MLDETSLYIAHLAVRGWGHGDRTTSRARARSAARSCELLPQLDLAELTSFVRRPEQQYEIVKAYVAALRGR